MITKAQIKHIRALEDKKYRYSSKEFVIEGTKLVLECIISGFTITNIYTTEKWLEEHSSAIKKNSIPVTCINSFELEKITSNNHTTNVVAIVQIPQQELLQFNNKVTLLLDTIQDPGNLGTIIRIADWYGIKQIICSEETVDVYNTKVVQASMGSIFRVGVFYNNIEKIISSNKNIPSFATVLQAKNINEIPKIKEGFIVIGNEGKGISNSVLQYCSNNISIQAIGNAESLNAAVATGIVCHCLLS